jgi:hypothetical protein
MLLNSFGGTYAIPRLKKQKLISASIAIASKGFREDDTQKPKN